MRWEQNYSYATVRFNRFSMPHLEFSTQFSIFQSRAVSVLGAAVQLWRPVVCTYMFQYALTACPRCLNPTLAPSPMVPRSAPARRLVLGAPVTVCRQPAPSLGRRTVTSTGVPRGTTPAHRRSVGHPY